jgi:predicted SprT family Zn-dependent metalloprotease
MPLFKQLELDFQTAQAVAERALRLNSAPVLQLARHRDHALEQQARKLLRSHTAARIGPEIRVEWNPRLKTCAGRADFRRKLISLNPLLRTHGETEIDRTFLHELAHLLAQFRAGRRRISPHGPEWRRACEDLGISDETRCHNLPFPVTQRHRRFVYRCPNCRNEFPRARKIRRVVACLSCCRKHNRGKFDSRFRLRLVKL